VREAGSARGGALLDALELRGHRYVFIVGSGGKTTLMFALAAALSRSGRRVITSTSTRIFPPTPRQSPRVVVEPDADRLIATLAATALPATAVAGRRPDGKLQGLPLPVLDRLRDAPFIDHLLVEADGSRGLPLKAHGPDEPVVSHAADLVIAVVGADSVGRLPTDEHVHRAELLRRRLGLSSDGSAPLSPDDVARAMLHHDGFLHAVAPGTQVRMLVSRADAAPTEAVQLAEAVARADTVDRVAQVLIAELCGSSWGLRGWSEDARRSDRLVRGPTSS
jgi:probable selenium-dependent hydroxylase accessory protein YqeC